MEWIERFNSVINYIEENITQQIDYEEIAKIACCSSYHFQRMFTYMAGIPLSEYIRKRKMSLAAVDLQGGDKRVVDVAGKYGYNSPTAFNRAFHAIHGISPSAVKSGNVYVKSFPRLLFKLVVKSRRIELSNRNKGSVPYYRSGCTFKQRVGKKLFCCSANVAELY